MARENEFVSQRFQIASRRLEDPDEVMSRQDRIRLQRERHLLGKILDEVDEGQVMRALNQWRGYLGAEWVRHKKIRKAANEAYAQWWNLPDDERALTPMPKRPSFGAKVADKNDYVWIVDDRFLAMLDDLIERLGKWLNQ